MDSKPAGDAPDTKMNGANSIQMLDDFPPLGNAGEPTRGVEIAVPSCSGDVNTNTEEVQALPTSDDAGGGRQYINNNMTAALQGIGNSIQPSSSASLHSVGRYSAPPPIYARPQCYGLPVPFLGPHMPPPPMIAAAIPPGNVGSEVTNYHENPLTRVVEFRSDITLGTVFQPTYAECPLPLDPNMFHPTESVVVTRAESVIHYVNQPYTNCVNGKWISGIAHLPLAHHICICLDDGVRRYESITRIDILCPEEQRKREVTGIQSREPFLKQLNYRITPTGLPHPPDFKKAIRESLMELIAPYGTEQPYEICCTRQNGKYVQMDRHIDTFTTSQDPFQSYFYPIIHYAEQKIEMNLFGARYHFTGTIYRPFLKAATLLLSSGNLQLMDTVELKVCPAERRIYCLSYDTTIGRKDEQNGHLAINIVDSVSYIFEGNYKYWGPELASTNPRLPSQYHPFKNLDYNPFINQNFNPYHTFSFQVPQIPTHPTIPSAIPGNLYHGDFEHSGVSVIPYIGPADQEDAECFPNELVAPQLDLITSQGSSPSSSQASGSKLNPEAQEFNPMHTCAGLPTPSEISSLGDPRPFPAPELANMLLVSASTSFVGPIYFNPTETSFESGNEYQGPFGDNCGSTTHPATSIESFGTLVGPISSTQHVSEQSSTSVENVGGYTVPEDTSKPSTVASSCPTLGLTTSTSWAEEMEAHHEYELETFPNNAILAGYNQVDETGRPLRCAPSRDWYPTGLSSGVRGWNQSGSSSSEWIQDGPSSYVNRLTTRERTTIACPTSAPIRTSSINAPTAADDAPRSREWNSGRLTTREWNSGRPATRDWNPDGPAIRDWNPDGPPNRDWNRNRSTSHEWDQNWRPEPGFSRDGGYRNQDEYRRDRNFGYGAYRGGRDTSSGYGNMETEGERENGSNGHQEDPAGYHYTPRANRGFRGRGGRAGGGGGRGNYYNSYRPRERDEVNPNLIVCSPRASDIDVFNRIAPTSGRKEQKTPRTPRKANNKKLKTPRTPRQPHGKDDDDKACGSGTGTGGQACK